MLNKKDAVSIMDKLSSTYNYLERKDEKYKSNLLKAYLTELQDYNCDEILKAIDKLSNTSKFIPSVAEIKVAINNFSYVDSSNANLNSSYFYKNLREYCDAENVPYYDITKGANYPLEPFKNQDKK